MNKRAEYNTTDLTNTEMRSKWTGNKVKKVAGGQWEDQKTKELILDYQVYRFVSLSARIKE
tara:strand:- start:41 stop:223 length:183 start_codon:yes stop_codon:yes gene_type:complete